MKYLIENPNGGGVMKKAIRLVLVAIALTGSLSLVSGCGKTANNFTLNGAGS